MIESARRAAARAGVPIVTGDTKVVGRGSGDQIFINTSGIGVVPAGRRRSAPRSVRAGRRDPAVRHRSAITASRSWRSARGSSSTATLASDTAALARARRRDPATRAPTSTRCAIPTRGGLAATLVEIASRRRLGIEVDEAADPGARRRARRVRAARARSAAASRTKASSSRSCPRRGADAALAAHARASARPACSSHRRGHRRCTRASSSSRTPVGGRRILDLPFAEPLPRIC